MSFVNNYIIILTKAIILLPAFVRMPYLANKLEDMGPMGKMLLTVDKVEALPSPRVIRPHLPFYLLPPDLLDTSKV